MTIRRGEIGRTFILATGFDMSAFTELRLTFTDPNGTSVTVTTADGVTAPAVPLVDDPDVGDQPASTYFQFVNSTDIYNTIGTWTVCGAYVDAAPSTFFTGKPQFEVLEGC
jgi:hypothetical protein